MQGKTENDRVRPCAYPILGGKQWVVHQSDLAECGDALGNLFVTSAFTRQKPKSDRRHD